MKFLINISILFFFLFLNIPNAAPIPVDRTQSLNNAKIIPLINKTSELSPTLQIQQKTDSLMNKKTDFSLGALLTKEVEHEKKADENESLSESIKKSKFIFILGVIFCFIALFLTIKNETETLQKDKMFLKMFKFCKEASGEIFEKELNGKLVLVSGIISSNAKIFDDVVGISVDNSLKLFRIVEMNQWKEILIDGKIVYQQIWTSEKINSANFKNNSYQNPEQEEFFVENKVFYSESSKLGDIEIYPYHIDAININKKSIETVIIDKSYAETIEENLKESVFGSMETNIYIQIKNNYIYIKSNNNKVDSVGDLRIIYQHIPSKDYTFIAGVYENTLVPYDISGSLAINDFKEQNLKKMNKKKEIFWVQPGKKIKQEMFKIYDTRNGILEWVWRVLGFFICFLGVVFILTPFGNHIDSLKLIGSMGSFSKFVFAFILTNVCLLFIIGIFWVFRKIEIGLFLVCLWFVFLIFLIVVLTNGEGNKDKKKFL